MKIYILLPGILYFATLSLHAQDDSIEHRVIFTGDAGEIDSQQRVRRNYAAS